MNDVSIGILADVKKLFFDPAELVHAVDRAEKQELSRAGAYVRRTAKKSMGSRRSYSRPGHPPSAHKNPLLKSGVLFAFEPSSRVVVVGPVKINRGGAVPALMEFGGDTTGPAKTYLDPSTKQRVHLPAGPRHYEPRPFMGPALEENAPKFPKLFANSIHR